MDVSHNGKLPVIRPYHLFAKVTISLGNNVAFDDNPYPMIKELQSAILKVFRGYVDLLTEAESNLRKQARQIENEIDLKLVSFSKLGTSYGSFKDYGSASDTSPLLNKSSSDHMFETMAMEIEQLLAKLTEINDKMSDYTQNIGVNSQNAALLHTLQRHRDILQDYSHEFQKTRSNIVQQREREDLLGSVRRDIDAYKNSGNRMQDLYLKENEHLRNSERLVDEQIHMAMATKENLLSQRGILGSVQQKMTALGNRFPVINNLVQKINFRKRRDSIIIGVVIAVCLILMLLYAFH